MLAKKDTRAITIDDYLRYELSSPIKHQLIDGTLYAMAGASANHERLAGNLYSEFRNHLKGTPCEPFGSNMKLKVNHNFFYPDVMVACHFDNGQPYFTETPIIIIEILSRATRKTDETLKLMSYINIPSLKEYVLIEQDIVDIQVLRRNEGWIPKHYFMGDMVTFESITLTLSVQEIYDRVQNQDVLEFLNGTANSDY
jgi:Uma2 family endonuclease